MLAIILESGGINIPQDSHWDLFLLQKKKHAILTVGVAGILIGWVPVHDKNEETA